MTVTLYRNEALKLYSRVGEAEEGAGEVQSGTPTSSSSGSA